MKVKLLVFAAALLMLTSLSFGQNFFACIASVDFQLTGADGNPLPDGTPGYIYWDSNSNGPDAADPLANVCALPPDCPTGPGGSLNFNTFALNGEAVVGMAGTFANDPCLTSSGSIENPGRYYVRVVEPCPAGTEGHGVIWTSIVMTMVVGPQEFWFGQADWTMTPANCIPVGPTCTYSGPVVNFIDTPGHPGPRDITLPVELCTDNPCATVQVGPLGTDAAVAATRIPHVVLGAGDCQTPGAGWSWTDDYAGWSLVLGEGGQYFYVKTICIGNGTQGCASLHFDFILAAQMGNIAITPSDNAVIVKFNTLAETDLARFEIVRDGALVAKLDAANSPNGHEYTYTDATAANGTSYNYELVMVNANGSRSTVKAERVTPSMNKLVVTEYALHQNFPNPFNPTTSIRLDLVEKNFVTLKVYNATGQEVATVLNGERAAGVNLINFDASNLTSGLYFYTVKVGNVYSATKKMLLVK